MSCNGCRVLRKGCSETCILRPCLQWIESADAQGHATVFVAKFFGRAGLMGFITAAPENQRPALFQSLLLEACGRTVNPVFGAVGLLWAGNWQVCQAAVETVLKGGSLKTPSPCSPSFSTPTQGPLHPSFPGKDLSAAHSRRESLMPSIITVTNESTPEICKATVRTIPFSGQFQKTNGYESKDYAAVKSSWDRKWDGNIQQQEWPKQQQGSVKGNVKSNVNSRSEDFGNTVQKVGKKREQDFLIEASGFQVLAPASRRVRPCVMDGIGIYGGKTFKESLYDDQEIVGSSECLDLGLTLKVKDGKGGHTGWKRVYSPCDSVNSEGSITSLDTTPRYGHCPSFASPMFGGDMAGHMYRKLPLLPLLPLLL